VASARRLYGDGVSNTAIEDAFLILQNLVVGWLEYIPGDMVGVLTLNGDHLVHWGTVT
jgi:hypothetical protein